MSHLTKVPVHDTLKNHVHKSLNCKELLRIYYITSVYFNLQRVKIKELNWIENSQKTSASALTKYLIWSCWINALWKQKYIFEHHVPHTHPTHHQHYIHPAVHPAVHLAIGHMGVSLVPDSLEWMVVLLRCHSSSPIAGPSRLRTIHLNVSLHTGEPGPHYLAAPIPQVAEHVREVGRRTACFKKNSFWL